MPDMRMRVTKFNWNWTAFDLKSEKKIELREDHIKVLGKETIMEVIFSKLYLPKNLPAIFRVALI